MNSMDLESVLIGAIYEHCRSCGGLRSFKTVGYKIGAMFKLWHICAYPGPYSLDITGFFLKAVTPQPPKLPKIT